MSRILLLLLVGIVIAGCATASYRTEGVSGPVAWRATDMQTFEWKAEGVEDPRGEGRQTYRFMLQLEETQGTALTLTKMQGTISQFDASWVPLEITGQWQLQPYGKAQLPFSITLYCNSWVEGCEGPSIMTPSYRLVFTGTDDKDQAVRLNIDLRLPPAPLVKR